MPVLNIGKVQITWKGAWSSSQEYQYLDGVVFEGSTYIGLSESTIGLSPIAEPAVWQLLAEKGAVVQVVIGSVSTVAPSQPATVSVSQVDNVATLDFQIPKADAPVYSVSGSILTITQ